MCEGRCLLGNGCIVLFLIHSTVRMDKKQQRLKEDQKEVERMVRKAGEEEGKGELCHLATVGT